MGTPPFQLRDFVLYGSWDPNVGPYAGASLFSSNISVALHGSNGPSHLTKCIWLVPFRKKEKHDLGFIPRLSHISFHYPLSFSFPKERVLFNFSEMAEIEEEKQDGSTTPHCTLGFTEKKSVENSHGQNQNGQNRNGPNGNGPNRNGTARRSKENSFTGTNESRQTARENMSRVFRLWLWLFACGCRRSRCIRPRCSKLSRTSGASSCRTTCQKKGETGKIFFSLRAICVWLQICEEVTRRKKEENAHLSKPRASAPAESRLHGPVSQDFVMRIPCSAVITQKFIIRQNYFLNHVLAIIIS